MEPHKPAKAGGGLEDRGKGIEKKGGRKRISIWKNIVKVERLQFKIDMEGKCQQNESGMTEGSERNKKINIT